MRPVLAALGVLAVLLPHSIPLSAEPVAVRFQEGSVHGYLALRSLDGKLLAAGDLIQVAHGDRLTVHLVYRFKDGSVDDDTAVATQDGHFHLISDHHIQRGPSFPTPVDVTITTASGEVTVRYVEHGEQKVETEHLDLPPDLANGILLSAIKNIPPNSEEVNLPFLVTTPKPRLIHLIVKTEATDRFRSAGVPNKAVRFRLHPEIGGIAGVLAPLVGKQPPDAHVWISQGEAPAFLRAEVPLFLGGALLRTELISPVWSRSGSSAAKTSGR